MLPTALKDQLAAWQAAGIVDAATAARIEAFESARPPADRTPSGISVSEVVAYIGSVVLLAGVGFLYGTQYAALGVPGRLLLVGLVVIAGFAVGNLVRLLGGATGAARRARSAGWTVGALALTTWIAQAFADSHVLTQAAIYQYDGAPDDTSGSIMLAAGIGFVIATGLLWRSGAGLVAFATAVLGYTAAGAFDVYLRSAATPWGRELSWLVPGAALGVIAEVLTIGHERRWAREVSRFLAVLAPVLAALIYSFNPDDGSLEFLAGFLALAAFGLAWWRGSAGYAIAGGVALFAVVVEVGVRHFAQSLGFPIVLIVCGLTLFAVAGGLFAVMPRLRRRTAALPS